MKIFRGISTFLLILLVVGACFEPPEFPAAPQIAFNGVSFIDTPDTDSLVIHLTFRDGDGDLGLPPRDLRYISDPYHPQWYFQDNGSGGLDSIATYSLETSSGVEYYILDIANPSQGKLIFERTRNQPGFSFLPPLNCQHYEILTTVSNVLVEADDLDALDQIAIDNIIDTLSSATTTYYQIVDTLYRRTNLNHYNMEVRFYQFNEGTQKWEEFDWGAPPFCQPFHMRFPVLSDTPGRALEGTLRYAMPSIGFMNLFSIKRLNLKVRVKDRQLNHSRVVESGEFTLQDILIDRN